MHLLQLYSLLTIWVHGTFIPSIGGGITRKIMNFTFSSFKKNVLGCMQSFAAAVKSAWQKIHTSKFWPFRKAQNAHVRMQEIQRQHAASRAAALNKLQVAADAPANPTAQVVTAEELQSIAQFTTILEAAITAKDFSAMWQHIVGAGHASYLNWLHGELPLHKKHNKYSPANFWREIAPERLAEATEDNRELTGVISRDLMSIPVYLLKANGGRTYMDLFAALTLLKHPYMAKNANGIMTGPCLPRNPETREVFSIRDIKYDPIKHQQLLQLKATLLHKQQNPQANLFDAKLEEAIAAKDLSIFFAYLSSKGGESPDGKLINWTAELKQELATSKFKASDYWDGKISTARRTELAANDEYSCIISYELIRVPVRINDTYKIDLLQLLMNMQYRDTNPGTNLAITNLTSIQFDAARAETMGLTAQQNNGLKV